MKVLGLMSGTSLDGIDAALCEIEGSGANLKAQITAFECIAYKPDLRARLGEACANRADAREVARLNFAVGEAFANAANQIFERFGRAELIGSHGQTICHLPDENVTLQIGEGAIIAEKTGVTTVWNFRPRDLACGGQGAPLVPYADWILLRSATKNRVVQNIGGISNCTILPANCELNQVRAWDCGPGNLLIDAASRQFFGLDCDQNGELAAVGDCRLVALGKALKHPFFAKKPPKTAGREEFGEAFLENFLLENPLEAHDVLRTLTRLTARTIADSLRQNANFDADFELIVGGGGAFNPVLMNDLRQEFPDARVLRHENFGIRSDAKEALAFAILASETLKNVPTSVPGATGARKSAILGQICFGN